MTAVRKEGLYFWSNPWESFPSLRVQEVLAPLHSLAAQFDQNDGGEILLAFPIVAYWIVNDFATQQNRRQFHCLYRRTPLMASRLLDAATEYLTQPMDTWDMRRAMINWSSQHVWTMEARSTRPTFRLPDFKNLQATVSKYCPQLKASNASLIRRKHYYELHRELVALWGKWHKNIEAALLIRNRARWLTVVSPVLRTAKIR